MGQFYDRMKALWRVSTGVLLLWAVILPCGAVAQEGGLPALRMEDLLALPSFPGDLGPLPAYTASAEEASRIDLGKYLFFDARLSTNGQVSCATCHRPDLAWTDGHAMALGQDGQPLTRNTPTILNSGLLRSFFWDGRTSSAEDQVKGPIIAPNEHGFESEGEFNQVLAAIPHYVDEFKRLFDRPPNLDDAALAIVAFEKSLSSPNARFDRFITGTHDALTDLEKQGLTLFVSKASCTLCHHGPTFSDGLRHTVSADGLAMRTPDLRNVGVTAPYMHNGRFTSLAEVVAFYNRGGDKVREQSPLIFPLGLSAEEEGALVAFLLTLTGDIEAVEIPEALREFAPTPMPPPAPGLDSVPVPPTTFDSTKSLMVSGIHEQFSFLGFNIWHTPKMHKKVREMIVTSADSMEGLAIQSTKLFAQTDATEAERDQFQEGMRSLAAISKSLAQSARHGTHAEVLNQFARMEQNCNACHQTFRPDLVWTGHHAH